MSVNLFKDVQRSKRGQAVKNPHKTWCFKGQRHFLYLMLEREKQNKKADDLFLIYFPKKEIQLSLDGTCTFNNNNIICFPFLS